MTKAPEGPIIAWEDYGTEGWHPKSYPTLREAIEAVDCGYGRRVYTMHIDLAKQVIEPKTPVDRLTDTNDSRLMTRDNPRAS